MPVTSLRDRLLQILIDDKLITEEQLGKAMEVQKRQGGPLSQVLIDENYITEEVLMVSLSEHLGIPPININRVKVPKEIVNLIPKQLATFYQVIPISKMGNTLTVAMADPLNVFALDDLKLMSGMEIQPVVSNPRDVKEKLEEVYSSASELENLLKDTGVPELEVAKEQQEEIDIDELLQATGDTSVIKVVNILLVQAVQEGASDVHIEPFEKEIKVRYRIDGVLYDRTAPPKQMGPAIVSRIKIMANLDIAERRLPQDGRFRIKLLGKEVDFRISILPTAFGEKVVMRILDKSSLNLDLEDLGFDGAGLERFREAIRRPHGMIIVSGPTGSGKTTTLYAALSEINTPNINLVTVEDPIEYQLMRINQVQVNQDIGLTFANGLRSILRQDPDVVMVGEIRDFETADISVKAALTGHLVFTTLHTNDAAGAITRLNDMGIEPFLISSSLILVLAQRLVRKICTSCKEEIEIDEGVLRRAQVPLDAYGDAKFYHGRGCKKCGGSGYRGRMSVFEVLKVTEAIKNLVIRQASSPEIKKKAMENGMRSLRMNAIDKAVKGYTALEEVLRVTAPD